MKEMKDDFFCGDDSIYSGVLSLIGAMLRLAAQDAKYGDRKDVLEFIKSDWFCEICDCLGLSPSDVRKRILTSKVKQRSEYRS